MVIKKTNIAVILTCYNRKDKTLTCLHSLETSTQKASASFEIFLVDDGSTDGTSVAVKKEFPAIHIIPGNGNLFWNRGMHLAWEIAAKQKDFDFYLWLNDDVKLFPDALETLLNAAKQHTDSIITGTMQSKRSGKITYGGFNEDDKLIVPGGMTTKCKKFHGNLVLVPNSAYLKLGNLDPFYIHAIGDFDYSLRAYKHGIMSYVASAVTGYCEEHERLPLWCLPETPLKQRLKTLYSPLGNSHPRY